jgi:hypothetical protein
LLWLQIAVLGDSEEKQLQAAMFEQTMQRQMFLPLLGERAGVRADIKNDLTFL